MRRLQLQLLQLQGIPIKATVDCQKKVSGLLGTAGRDFVQINTHGQFVFILYEQLISLEWDQDAKLDHEPEFLKTDKETRRQMVFNFGEFVGKRPELVNLFFGLTLQQYLMDFLGKKILIKTIDHYNIKGILSNSDGVRVQIMTQNGLQEIDWGTICYMEIMDLRA